MKSTNYTPTDFSMMTISFSTAVMTMKNCFSGLDEVMLAVIAVIVLILAIIFYTISKIFYLKEKEIDLKYKHNKAGSGSQNKEKK